MRLTTVAWLLGLASLPFSTSSILETRSSRSLSALQPRASSSGGIPPESDPFYTAPSNLASATPGQVLRMRTAPPGLCSQYSSCAAAYNLLYRTTNSLGNATFGVTTFFIPDEPSSKCNDQAYSPLVSYQVPYDSVDLNASPSYAMYADPITDVETLLSSGYFVNVPDFEGPLASFTAGLTSGYSTLDSIRAVRSAGFNMSLEAPYAMWGYSGGALGSEWAAELAPTYAPELSFAGAALGGLTPNVTSVLYTVDGTVAAGLIPPGILGLTNQFTDVYNFVVDSLVNSTLLSVPGTSCTPPLCPQDRASFLAAYTYDLSQAEMAYLFQRIENYFSTGFAGLFTPDVQNVINTNGIMGLHGTPQMPIYAYKAINDEISPIADTDALVHKFCAAGVSIVYDRNMIGGHSAEQTNGKAAALQFLARIFKNNAQTGCVIQNVTQGTDLSPLKKRVVKREVFTCSAAPTSTMSGFTTYQLPTSTNTASSGSTTSKVCRPKSTMATSASMASA